LQAQVLAEKNKNKKRNQPRIEAKREQEDGENTTKMAIEIVIQSRLDFYELRLQNQKKKNNKMKKKRIIKKENIGETRTAACPDF